MRNRKELVVGRYPGIEVLPDQLVLDDLRNRIRRQLIEPFDDFLAGPAWKGIGVPGGEEGRKTRESRTAPGDEFSTLNLLHDGDSRLRPACRMRKWDDRSAWISYRGNTCSLYRYEMISVLLDVKVKGIGAPTS